MNILVMLILLLSKLIWFHRKLPIHASKFYMKKIVHLHCLTFLFMHNEEPLSMSVMSCLIFKHCRVLYVTLSIVSASQVTFFVSSFIQQSTISPLKFVNSGNKLWILWCSTLIIALYYAFILLASEIHKLS